jgi:hypothetical protein
MNKHPFILLFLVVLSGLLFPLGASAQTKAGAIKAVRLEGQVMKLLANGTQAPLHEGESLTEHDTLVTGDGASVVLVFMNGSSARLGANTQLAIEEFKMDPLEQPIAVANLAAEPTVSRTTLNLVRGEMVGNVKKLNSSSSYNIRTAVGAAGIRGTTFRIVMTPDATGKAYTFTLSTAEGVVVFTGTVPAGGTAAAPVAVAAGKQVSATAEFDPATNAVVVNTITVPTEISKEAVEQISSAVTTAIKEAQEQTNFSTNEQQNASQSTTKGGENTGENPSSNQQQTSGDSSPKSHVDPVVIVSPGA